MNKKDGKCSCGEEKYGKSGYCYECYIAYSKNQKLRKRTKENEEKFDNLSKYIKEMEDNGGFELKDISKIIEMYDSFFGNEFSFMDRSVSYMWRALKRLNEKKLIGKQ
jgi:hypothetical protein